MQGKDGFLVKKLISRDERAIYKFYKTHKKPLFNFLLRQIGQENDVEEVLQDTFIAFFESLRNFQGKCSLKTFLYSIAKRKAIDKIRRKKIKSILFSYFPERVIESFKAVFLDDEIDRRVLAQKIEKVFTKLSNEHRQILRLKYLHDYKVVDIARELEISFKAAESMLFRARKSFINQYNRL